MAIFGIGASYEKGTVDVSKDFIQANLVGVGHDDAPELHQFVRTLKVGDIVYIKSFSPSPKSRDIIVKAIGVIKDDKKVKNRTLVSCGRNVKWVDTQEFRIPKPKGEKNNVRNNSIYEEFHPDVQCLILEHL